MDKIYSPKPAGPSATSGAARKLVFSLTLFTLLSPITALTGPPETPHVSSTPNCYRIADHLPLSDLKPEDYWQLLCPQEEETPNAPINLILNDFRSKQVQSVCTLDGTAFNPRHFRNDFSRRLYFGDAPNAPYSSGENGCHEQFKSDLISEAFDHHLSSLTLPETIRLQNALIDYVDFFGVNNSNGEKILQALCPRIFDHYHDKIQAFLSEISKRMKEHNDAITSQGGPKEDSLAIVYSTSGGAHSSIANVLESVLTQDGFKVAKINESEIYRDHDILRRFAGIDRADIYNRVSQQGRRDWCRRKLHQLQSELENFIPNTRMDTLRLAVGQAKIIASTGHKPYNARLVADGHRVCFQVCDFGEFNSKLSSVAETVLKFGLEGMTFHCPSKSTILKGKDLKVDFSDKELQEKYSQYVKIHSYPVHEAFKQLPSEEGRQKVFSTYQLRPDAKLYTLSMGQQGVSGILEAYLDSLINGLAKDPNPLKIDCLILRGNNVIMETSLEKHFKQQVGKLKFNKRRKITQYLRIKFVPRVSQEEVAAIGKASDVFLSKPGGATTAEALAANLPIILHLDPNHPWERDNATELHRELGSPILDSGIAHRFYEEAKKVATRERIPSPTGSSEEREKSIDYTLKVLFELESSMNGSPKSF